MPFIVSTYPSTPWSICVYKKGTDTPQFPILMFEVHIERNEYNTVSNHNSGVLRIIYCNLLQW